MMKVVTLFCQYLHLTNILLNKLQNQFPLQITFQPAKLDTHFEQIIALQQKNLYKNLNEDQQAQQGFVYAEHTVELLKKMADDLLQIVALAVDKVIGYNLAMPAKKASLLPELAPMFAAFDETVYKGKPLKNYIFIVGGQVCVDANFRGQGLLSRLYHATKDHLPGNYDLCVTEVSSRNHNSLKVHQKMGFEHVHTYEDGAEIWNVIVWDMMR